MKKNLKKIIFLLGATIVLVLIDQITKAAAVNHLKGQEDLVLLPGVFQLQYLENRGSAFGMLQGQRVLFILIALVALCAIPYLYLKIPDSKRFHLLRLIAVLFLAGAVGNAIDRILQGYVVDFFYFSLINFPIFNVADIYVSIAAILLVFALLFIYKEDELQMNNNKR